MIGNLRVFFQVFFHDLPVVFQVMKLQFRCSGFKGINFLQDFHPQVEQLVLAPVFSLPRHFDLYQLFLCVLFWIKDAVQLRTLIADPFFVDQ